MAHEITQLDNVGLRGESAWHGLGTVIQENLSAVGAAERFKLCWPVARLPLFFQDASGAFQPVDSHVANVRTADADGAPIQHLLGVVGADYEICQNRELAEFTDALAQSGSVTIESCGSIRGGKRVWFLARGDAFSIGDRDTVYPYVLVSNGHDGTQSIRVTPTTVRVVCSNTLHMVIPADEYGTRPESAAIAIRHCGKIADKLEQAKRALAYYADTLRRNRELFEAMQSRQFDRAQTMQLFANTYAAFWEVATADELSHPDADIRRTAKNRMERMQRASEAFLARLAQETTSLGIGETAWSVFNAMTGFIQHDKTARGKDDTARVERRMESNLFGINSTRTHDVLATALALSA